MDEAGIDLQGALGVMLRQWRIVAAALIVGLGIAGLALLAVRPLYSATTLVMVDPSHKDLIAPDAQQVPMSESARLDSEVELIKSPSIMLATVRDLDLLNEPEFEAGIGLRERLLQFFRLAEPRAPAAEQAVQTIANKLASAITVQRRGLTFLILVEARAHQPETAARIANAVTDAYIREQLRFKIDGLLAARKAIEARIPELSAAVARSETAFDQFIDANLMTIAEQTGRMDLLELQRQLQSADAERRRATIAVHLAQESLASHDYLTLADTLQSQSLAELEQDRRGLQGSIELTAAGSSEADTLQTQLGGLSIELEASAWEAMSSLGKRVSQAEQQADSLRNRLRAGVLEANLPAAILTDLYALQLNAENARAQYQTLLSRLQTLESQAYLQVADSRVVAKATPPTKPDFPDPSLVLTLATLVSLAIGSGGALMAENAFGGFTSEEQLGSALRLRFTLGVPRQKHGLGPSETLIEAPLSPYAEAMRRVRAACDQAFRQSQSQSAVAGGGMVVMVSSAVAGEGKSTIALSLARACALAGNSTLLIDCDLRRPSVHRLLELEPASGLVDVLAAIEGARPKAEVTTRDAPTGLQVIPGVRRGDMPTDQLISGAAFSRLLEHARTTFDVVVLDTPPIEPVVDGLYMAPIADVVLFVVNRASTPQRQVKRAVEALAQAKRAEAEIVAVLNQQGTSRARYPEGYDGGYARA